MKIIITESQYELLNEQLYKQIGKLFKSSPKIVKPISKTISKSISSELDGLIKTYIQKVGEDEFIKLKKSLLNKEISKEEFIKKLESQSKDDVINKTSNSTITTKLEDPIEKSFLVKIYDSFNKLMMGKNLSKFMEKIKNVATFKDYTLKFNNGVKDATNQLVIDISKNDEKVGKFVAFIYENSKTKKVSLQIQKVEIYPKYKGKGIMRTFYQDFNTWLKENFNEFDKFTSDFIFLHNKETNKYDGFNMWESLVKKGLAKRLGPPENYIPPTKPQDGHFWFLKTGYELL